LGDPQFRTILSFARCRNWKGTATSGKTRVVGGTSNC
jgi:hypothetical protein